MLSSSPISDRIIQYFARENGDMFWAVTRVLENRHHYLSEELHGLVSSIGNDNETARLLTQEIAMRRLAELQQIRKAVVPLPYAHPDLEGTKLDEHFLVDISNFETSREAFERGNTAFQICLALPELNSMYWAKKVLLESPEKCTIRVRLDPFIMSDRNEYSWPFYKMWVYGVPLDWERIGALREEEHARWMPDYRSLVDVQFTDVVWAPRDDGIHFQCEEVPKPEAVEVPRKPLFPYNLPSRLQNHQAC